MKKDFKRILSIILCLTVLAAFAPMVYADDIVISKVSAEYAIPAAGEQFDFSKISVPEGAHYKATIHRVYHFVGSEAVYVNSGDVIEEGVRYYVRIEFNADSGYKLDEMTNLEVVINGAVCKTWVGTDLIETGFTGAIRLPDEPDPPTPTVWQTILKVLSIIFFPITFIVKAIRSIIGK